MSPNNRSRLIIAATFLVAYILTSLPGPQWAEQFRPDWVGLVLIYWCMATPQYVGVTSGWFAGLLLDVLYGSLLGQQALAKALVAFVAGKLHLRVRVFPRWQQAAFVLLLLLLNQLLVLWIKGITGESPARLTYWTSSVVAMVIWPWIFIILRDIRRRGHVN